MGVTLPVPAHVSMLFTFATLVFGASMASGGAVEPPLPKGWSAPLEKRPATPRPRPAAPRPAPAAPTRASAPSSPDDPTEAAAPEGAVGRLDPAQTMLLRVSVLSGAAWRIQTVDPWVDVAIDYGRMRGFSGTFHTGFLPSVARHPVQSLDVPIGVGGMYRARARRRDLYASAGLTVGVLLHRGWTDTTLVYAVDPDLRLPVLLSWTFGLVGVTAGVVPACSFRTRTYERQDEVVWERHAFRIVLALGLHFDVMQRPASARPRTRFHPSRP